MEILVLAENRIGHTSEIDLKSTYKKGYPVNVMRDGQPWGTRETLPTFVIIKCPQITVAQGKQYESIWMKQIDYEVIESNQNNGTYQIRVFGLNVSSTAQNILEKAQIENYLIKWKCTVDGFASNEVTFTLSLWEACKSDAFWEYDVSLVGFTLVSYNSQNGTAIINADAAILNISDKSIASKIIYRGGNIISIENGVARFEINRNDVLQHFKKSVKQKVGTRYSRRMWQFDPDFIDTIVAAGGQLIVSKKDLLKNLINRLDQ